MGFPPCFGPICARIPEIPGSDGKNREFCSPHRWNGPRDMSPARPVVADRVASVPTGGGFADRVEDAAPRRGHLGHFDDRAGMALVEEIDERDTRGLAALAD